ncbi:MAG: FAD-binding protein [Saprospiraceae bacterium]|nr:FAD-binding protein [Saprospiraceae bacterium]
MVKEVEITVSAEFIDDESKIYAKALAAVGVDKKDVKEIRIIRRSVDARKKTPVFSLRVAIYIDELCPSTPDLLPQLKTVHDHSTTIIIIGAGPAGYFAALQCIELGMKPIILERGKDVRDRRFDLKAIQQFGLVDEHSNYCFGEGGAGTYSDGKLYTRSHKRGNIEKILRLLVEHGASSDILIDTHPHIGSNKLPHIVANIRKTILAHGGEIHFNSCVTDFEIKSNKIHEVIVNNGKQSYRGEAVVLATGHSARDIYFLLHNKNIKIEAKPFALGVRIEHPQSLIDSIQYRQSPRDRNLPAASYKLVCQVKDRGVFSFCMCPGGLIVPSATAPGEIVVNGMSMSRRDSFYANSGMVVEIRAEDVLPYKHFEEFAMLEFQKNVEQSLFKYGDGSQKAPSLRLTDFINKKISKNLASSSYIPGLYAAPLFSLLPKGIYERLRDGFLQFDKKMKGFYTEEANVIATESRTSSPIRIPRVDVHLHHPDVINLFPCGEGAGYAGGILSAAMDGQNVAKAIGVFFTK